MTTEYISIAETAKLVRQSLKESFPGVQFGVRSKSWSLGGAVYVSWTDGPNAAQVEAVAGRFAGSYFDAGIDYKGSVSHLLDGRRVRFCADSIHCTRHYSDESVQRAIDRFARHFAGNLRDAAMAKPTVAQYREGALISVQVPGLGAGLHHTISREISMNLAKASDRLRVKHSKTAGRIFVTHDDGYGRANGSGGGSRELAAVLA